MKGKEGRRRDWKGEREERGREAWGKEREGKRIRNLVNLDSRNDAASETPRHKLSFLEAIST